MMKMVTRTQDVRTISSTFAFVPCCTHLSKHAISHYCHCFKSAVSVVTKELQVIGTTQKIAVLGHNISNRSRGLHKPLQAQLVETYRILVTGAEFTALASKGVIAVMTIPAFCTNVKGQSYSSVQLTGVLLV